MTRPVVRDFDHLVIAAGPRVRIRRKVRQDATTDYSWRTNPEVVRYDGERPPKQSFEQFLADLEADLAFGAPEKEFFAIIAEDGEHIGNVMYYNADSYRGEAEFGITLGLPELRGNGLGTEVTVLFLRYLWQNSPFRRVYLHTLGWNARAISCFKKAGFNEVAHVLREGETFIRMEARREWWVLWDAEGRFEAG